MKLSLVNIKTSLLLALLLSPYVYSATVYKTVDSNGKVSYSDAPPAVDATQPNKASVEKISLPEYPETLENSDNHLQQMSETADKLKQDRLDREALELQKRQAELARQQAVYQPPIIVEENHYYPYRRPYNRYRDFPKIHKRPKTTVEKAQDQERDSRKLLIPRSKLLTP